MTWEDYFGRVEDGFSITLVLNILPSIFGFVGLGLILEQSDWGPEALFAALCTIYLPAAIILGTIAYAVRQLEVRRRLLQFLVVWGILTAGSFFIWWFLMLLPS